MASTKSAVEVTRTTQMIERHTYARADGDPYKLFQNLAQTINIPNIVHKATTVQEGLELEPQPDLQLKVNPQPYDDSEPKVAQEYYLPIYIITGVFAGLFIILPLVIGRKSKNRGIIQCSLMLAIFSMWIFWVTVYISEMHPLMGPRLANTTIAWIAHTWGKPAVTQEKST